MYSIYLYLYRSSASFLEIQMKKKEHKRAAFCECCANNIFLHPTSGAPRPDSLPQILHRQFNSWLVQNFDF